MSSAQGISKNDQAGADPPSQTNPTQVRHLAIFGAVAVSYLACAALATYPVCLTPASQMPGHLSDPLEHLWIMRWTVDCLIKGRSPFFCASLQYPIGVPLGLFPTMHLQTAGYLALGWLTSNDILRFNLLWSFGFVSTGMASFLLAWSVVRRFWPAWLGGLGVMLCGPMLMHAHGHLETMQMGALPLFLMGWLRFIDRPSLRSLAIATGLYLLVVASAPYFAVLAIFPAAWYVVWFVVKQARFHGVGNLRSHAAWLAAFVVVTLPGLTLLFSSQIWAALHGHAMTRPRSQFNWFGAPAWSYLTPTSRHVLGRLLPQDVYAANGYGGRVFECESYLGVVALALIVYSLVRRVRFERAGFWWSTLAMLVILSWGTTGPLGLRMPAGWLHSIFPPFQLIRVPARFNLFAAAVAVVPVAAGLTDLLDRIRSGWGQGLLILLIGGGTVADLAVVPFPTSAIPVVPTIYHDLIQREPAATFLDAPMFGSSQGHVLGSLCGYWQAIHHGRTSAGYSGVPNVPFDTEIVAGSPWSAPIMGSTSTTETGLGPIQGGSPRDAAWLFLTVHHYDYLMLHQGSMLPPHFVGAIQRWKQDLAPALVAEDADVAAFDRRKMAVPQTLVATLGTGWRPTIAPHSDRYLALSRATVQVYNPDALRPVEVVLHVPAPSGRSRLIRLVDSEGRELERWTLVEGELRERKLIAFRLPKGLQTLAFVSDAESSPTRHGHAFDEARSPFSFSVKHLEFRQQLPAN